MSTDRRPAAAVLVSIVLLALCTACGSGVQDDAAPGPATSTSSTSVVTPPAPMPTITLPPATTLPASSLEQSFAEFAGTLPGTVGIAVAPVGGNGAPLTFGDWSHGPAWSTIKVPLAIAAYRDVGGKADDDAEAAITRSDNAAAERLWELLGNPSTAAAAVQAVLREAGDDTTVVQDQRVRPEFSAFGQTDWSLAEQARFTAELPCLPLAEPVLLLMGSIVAEQHWGLAGIDGAQYKGGWGPDAATGKYLVRQIGLVPAQTGRTAVALVAAPESGSFSDGTAMLDELGRWVAAHGAELPGGTCA